MNFKALCNLILENEHQSVEVIPDNELRKYIGLNFFDDKKETELCFKYLKEAGYDKQGVFLAYMPERDKRPLPITNKSLNLSPDEFYFVFVPANFDREERKKFKHGFKVFLQNKDFYNKKNNNVHMANFYSTAAFIPLQTFIGMGGFIKYDPMSKYNLDDETKETWKDVITAL